MPRLTPSRYLSQRDQLRNLWFTDRGAFSNLSYRAQCYLHDYFAFTYDLTDDAARAHRRAVSLENLALPQKAGRAFAQLEASRESGVSQPHAVSASRISARGRRVAVRGLARPEIDYTKLAQAIMGIAEQIERERRGTNADADVA